MNTTKRWWTHIRGRSFGFERSTIWIGHEKYLDRWIIYFGWGTLRLHKFWRGDDVRASHTHPWKFWTFPLTTYEEDVYHRGTWMRTKRVQRFRWHARSADFEHIVMGRADWNGKPFYTLVITGDRTNKWGFYPRPGEFIYWRDYR